MAKRAASAPRGQHFLRSKRLAADLVARANVTRDALAVDLGAGTGAITRALAATGARVVAVESDPALAAALQRAFATVDRVTVEQADARSWSLPREPFTVVANLPFAGSGELLRLLLDEPRVPLVRAELIVQWGLANKRTAIWPSTLRGVLWRAWYELAVERHVAPNAFAPPPSVESAVLSVQRRHVPLVPPNERLPYERLLATGFATQTPLRRALVGLVGPRDLKRLAVAVGFALDACARDLDAHQWAQLYDVTRDARTSCTRAGRGTR